jgi:hypothetical protein
MKHLMQFSLASYILPLGADILSTLFSNNLNSWSSLNVRDKVSHPYKTAGKIVVSCISNLYIFKHELGK